MTTFSLFGVRFTDRQIEAMEFAESIIPLIHPGLTTPAEGLFSAGVVAFEAERPEGEGLLENARIGSEAQRQLLNPAQKNALRISLMLVEKGMLEVDRLLAAGEHQGLLFTITDDLPEDAKEALRQLIHEIREIIQALKDRFQLEMEVMAISRTIFGNAPLLWEMVKDTDASRLRGYGEIDPRLQEVLDPPLERLSGLLLEMHRVVAKNKAAA